MKLFNLLVCLASVVALATAIPVCRDNICQAIRCAMPQNCEGRIDMKGGYCGCCPACIQQLGEGEFCISAVLLGSPNTVECGHGLHCDSNTGRCAKSPKRDLPACQQKLEDYNQRVKQHGGMLLGAEAPICKSDGTFAEIQCRGSQCFCVTPDGNELQDYSVYRWEIQGMNCKCALDQAAYMKTGLIGRLFFCETNGNYKP